MLVADDYVGAVMSDLATRRGRVTGTESVGNGRSLVRAEVPGARGHAVRDRPALDLPRHGDLLASPPSVRPDAVARRVEGHNGNFLPKARVDDSFKGDEQSSTRTFAPAFRLSP